MAKVILVIYNDIFFLSSDHKTPYRSGLCRLPPDDIGTIHKERETGDSSSSWYLKTCENFVENAEAVLDLVNFLTRKLDNQHQQPQKRDSEFQALKRSLKKKLEQEREQTGKLKKENERLERELKAKNKPNKEKIQTKNNKEVQGSTVQ